MKKIIIIIISFFSFLYPIEAITGNYSIGDKITYNNIDFYVIKDNEDYVTLIKDTPLTKNEITKTNSTYVNQEGECSRISYGSTSDYATSNIKKVVDNWTQNNINEEDLYEDEYGYKSRVAKKEEVELLKQFENTKINCWYWTMTSSSDELSTVVYVVAKDFFSSQFSYYDNGFTVRPVITIKKEKGTSEEIEEIIDSNSQADSTKMNDQEITKIDDADNMSDSNDIIISDNEIVDVPNTLMKEPFLSTIIGGIMFIISIIVSIVMINYKTIKK